MATVRARTFEYAVELDGNWVAASDRGGASLPHDGDNWICRRDTSIRRPYVEVFEVSADGIPYLRPEICLRFKAKAVRDKDRADLEAALPRMSTVQRAWLHTALERVHPDHDWIFATE